MALRLEITTTWARIGIDQIQPRLDLTTHIPQLPRRTRPADVTIRREEPRLEIDQSHVKGELGYRELLAFARHFARRGQEEAAAGIKEKAREGDRMARYYRGENAIAALARENSRAEAEVNLALWPTRPPEIRVDSGGLAVEVEPGGTEIHYAPAQVRGNFTWGKVQVYLEQKPEIAVRAVFDARV